MSPGAGDAVLRVLARYRRALVALLLAAAAAVALESARPGPGPVEQVVVAGRDVTGDSRLAAGDVTVARIPSALVPDGALRVLSDALGRFPVGPVRRGELITDARLVAPGVLGQPSSPGLVAAPIRLADGGTAALVRAGDRVDVIATPMDAARAGVARTVATSVRVLAVPAPDDAVPDGALLVLETTPGAAAALAAAAVGARLSIVLRAAG